MCMRGSVPPAPWRGALHCRSVSAPIGAVPLVREQVLGIDPAIGISTARGGHALGVAGEHGNCRDSPIGALASSTYPVRSQQARAILIRFGDDAGCFVSPTPSDRIIWVGVALQSTAGSRRRALGHRIVGAILVRYFLSGTRRACKKGKPGHMSEPGRPLLLKRYPSSKSSKPKCALDLPRCRHNTNALRRSAILIQVNVAGSHRGQPNRGAWPTCALARPVGHRLPCPSPVPVLDGDALGT